jgi:hypothetical protein
MNVGEVIHAQVPISNCRRGVVAGRMQSDAGGPGEIRTHDFALGRNSLLRPQTITFNYRDLRRPGDSVLTFRISFAPPLPPMQTVSGARAGPSRAQ